jgi:phage terminase large subunit
LPSLEDIAAERRRRELARQTSEAVQRAGSWEAEKAKCAADPLYWFDTWVWTYDPRLIAAPGGAFVRMQLWPKQREVILWLKERIGRAEEGLLEKSRDMGATYLCAGYALHQWLFAPGFKATFGSRKVDYVDKKDNPDAIFPKIRIMLSRLPPEMLPAGFGPAHDNYMRLVNPESGAIISGEGGDDMGRGGRSSVYFLDEAAFVPNASDVEAALSGNTDCVIWVSSVNGMGNLFARKRHSILKPHQIMRLHWRDDPRKTEEWAAAKEASFSDPTGWASEYEIDYSASVEGICIPALWVESAKRLLALEPQLIATNYATMGLDVGAGKAKSVAIAKRGPVVLPPEARSDPDTTETAFWALGIANEINVALLNFDAVGVGAGVSSTLMKNPQRGLTVVPVNTGVDPGRLIWPDGRTSKDMFGNLKAELWWLARMAFQRTHEHVLLLQGREGGKRHPHSDLLAMPSGDRESDALALQLSLVKWGRNEKGKIVIEKKEALARRGIASPDHADAFVLNFRPPPEPDTGGLAGPMIVR